MSANLVFVHEDSVFAEERASWTYAHGKAEDLCRKISSYPGIWDLLSFAKGSYEGYPEKGIFSVRLYDRKAVLFRISKTMNLVVLADDIDGITYGCEEFSNSNNGKISF
jgi:hypothetical protein